MVQHILPEEEVGEECVQLDLEIRGAGADSLKGGSWMFVVRQGENGGQVVCRVIDD